MKKSPPRTTQVATGSGEEHSGSAPTRDAGKAVEESYLRQLEEENRRLKMAVVDLTLRNQALKLVVGKKW